MVLKMLTGEHTQLLLNKALTTEVFFFSIFIPGKPTIKPTNMTQVISRWTKDMMLNFQIMCNSLFDTKRGINVMCGIEIMIYILLLYGVYLSTTG